MNQDPILEAFRNGKLRFKPSVVPPLPRVFEHLSRTADGWLIGVEVVDELSKGLNQITALADKSLKFLSGVRPLSDGRRGFEFQNLYVEEAASEETSEDIDEPVTTDPVGAVHDQNASAAPAARQLHQAEAHVEPATLEWPTAPSTPAMLERRSEAQALSVSVPMPTEQPDLEIARVAEPTDAETAYRLAHEMLTDYHAERRRLSWYEDFMSRLEKRPDIREMVLQVLRDVDHWSDMTMSRGDTLCWDGLTGITTALPFEKPLVFVGYVEALDRPEHKRVKVSCAHLVTTHHSEAIRLLSRGNPATLSLGIGSEELGKRLALYWDRGLVRFKVRLKRGLALEAPYQGVIEDAYLEAPSIEVTEELTTWAQAVVARRPPNEPLWTDRSL